MVVRRRWSGHRFLVAALDSSQMRITVISSRRVATPVGCYRVGHSPATDNPIPVERSEIRSGELISMRPDQSIEIQLMDDHGNSLPLANVMIELSFYTNGRFRYSFGVGRTDSAGQLIVSYSDLEAIRKENAEFNLMDYNTKLDECDPRVEVVIESEGQLRDSYDQVLRYYSAPPDWAKIWPSNSYVRAHKKFADLTNTVTRVEM